MTVEECLFLLTGSDGSAPLLHRYLAQAELSDTKPPCPASIHRRYHRQGILSRQVVNLDTLPTGGNQMLAVAAE